MQEVDKKSHNSDQNSRMVLKQPSKDSKCTKFKLEIINNFGSILQPLE